jgi:hypothetical protein
MKIFRLQRAVLALGLLLMAGFVANLATPVAFGQSSNTGTVVGVVEDQSGAVIPGATITLIDNSTKTERKTTTSHTGQYVFANIPPGNYDITANKSGFAVDRVSGQTVTVGTQTTANFRLQVGSAQQTIEVKTSGADLQTINATVGSTVDPVSLDQLPSLLHDVGTFSQLQAGVSPDGSVAGAVVDQNTYSLDGGNNSNDMDGSSTVYTPSFAGDPTGIAAQNNGYSSPTGVIPTPADSVEEFKVNTSNQTADFNNSSGSQVEIVTKRGTEKWHATAYEYYLNNDINANTWDNNLSGTPAPRYHYSKYGFAGGGPVISKNIWGGKTFFFANYQAWRYPQSETYERAVPSADMANGFLTYGGTRYNMKTVDPRGIGIAPDVQTMWKTMMPAGNDTSCGTLSSTKYCDGVNEIGFKTNMAIPYKDNFFVARLDHDFGAKWHFMSSYRYYKLVRTTDSQVDIGGGFAGDKLGVATPVASRPQQPWFLVAGLTTNVTSNLTNDFHYSYLRNYWSWSTKNAPPQISGLGGALEPMGESATDALTPYNVNTQSIRTRFWDGKDNFFRDDLTYLKGNHLFQFGGQYQRNFDYHERSDNGGGINFTPTYQLGGSGTIDLSGLLGGFPVSSKSTHAAAALYGMVSNSQVAYTRQGPTLALNPPLTHAFDMSTIPYYNVYFSDTWHMKPSFTLSYGLGYTLEMPPTEKNGKQTVLVDDADTPVSLNAYINQREVAALAGNVYNPEIGFALVGNVGAGDKYPYNPFYGSFSPRVAAAWNPKFESHSLLGHIFGHDSTVIRGGYGHSFGRLNGVGQVLVPLLGVGLIQPVQCSKVLASGQCGPANPTASTVFRIGVDGTSAPMAAAAPTLPQPIYPGYNSAASSAAEGLDPSFRPNVIDSFDLTIQRQLSRKTLVEVGYIGRLIHHEYQPVNLNTVPYMMSQGGQQFQSAYAAIEKALGCTTSAAQCGFNVPSPFMSNGTTPNPAYGAFINSIASQPFFQASLLPAYCTGTFSNGTGSYANCTAAVVDNELGNLTSQSVWSMWSDLDNGNFNFSRTMMNSPIPGQANGGSGQFTSGVALNASIGHGNYNGGFVSFSTTDWHGVTLHENFTYSKAMGTGAYAQATSEYTVNDAFDLGKNYGVQTFNRKFVFNMYGVWQEPYYKDQRGIIGRLAGGWSIAPIFTMGNGEPVPCQTVNNNLYYGSQEFGSADDNDYGNNIQCVFTSKYNGGVHSHFGVTGGTDPYGNAVGTTTAGTTTGSEINMFANPVAVFDQIRPPILGMDTKNPGDGALIGLPYWNVDMSAQKNFRVWSHATVQLSFIFTNVFNHVIYNDPYLSTGSVSTWGEQNTQANTPRKMEFGARTSW